MRKLLVLFYLSFMTISLAFAGQTVEVSNNQPFVISQAANFTNMTGNSHYSLECGWGFFSDRPGNHKPYENSSDYFTTICADDPSKAVSITFQQFNLEKFDQLTVWDEFRTGYVTANTTPALLNVNTPGVDDGVDFLGTFTGPSSPGRITSKRGCLTFRFQSDASVVKTGWYGKIGCVNRPVVDPCPRFESRYVDSEIKCGVTITDDTFRGENNFEAYGSCTNPDRPSAGRELIYRFVNYSASDLTFTLREMNGSQPKLLNLFILNDCNANACTDAILRPAPNPNQGVESITIPNAAAGVYYVVVDGNRTYASNPFRLSVECTGGDFTTCSDPYYYDDFEAKDRNVNRPSPNIDYEVGDYLTIVNPFWFRRTGSVGLRDAKISDDRSSNGFNSLEINRAEEATQDVFLDLGQQFRGVHRISFDIFIEPSATAFFGIFGGDNSEPWGSISKEFGQDSGMQGRWFDVEIFVDLDRNRYTLFMDNRCQSSSGSYTLNLDALNFYGLPLAHYYIDRICYGPVSRIPSAGSITRVAIDMETPLFEEELVLQAEASFGAVETGLGSSEITLAVDKLVADDLKVMPNPTTGSTLIALDLGQEQAVQLQIFSPTGQLVRDIPLGKTTSIRQEVDLSDLINGLYILRATGEQSVITKKIILQK